MISRFEVKTTTDDETGAPVVLLDMKEWVRDMYGFMTADQAEAMAVALMEAAEAIRAKGAA